MSILNTLPGDFYASVTIFRDEMERIFYKRWVCVGRADQIPNPGDFFIQNIGDESLIITRDRSGAPRAFYNVCRHRGTRLCADKQGRFHETIQCPYHAWTYTLDGRLVGAPNMNEIAGFDKRDYPLYSACLETWQGFLFVNLDPEPEPLSLAFAPLEGKFDRWNVASLRLARRINYDVQANWKLLVENYSECYHCPLVHPALAKLSSHLSGANDLVDGPHLGGYMVINEEHESMTMTGGTRRPPLGEVSGDDLRRVYYYSIFPNTLLSLHPDYVMAHTLWPQSPEHTLITCEWLFDPETMARPDFNPDDAVEFWDMTNRQDWHICEESQIGMRSRVYRPGPLHSVHENLPVAFDHEVLKALGHYS
ncbi:MAG: aromatic ring-hydroxylating dioxygenase subunit alpha [Chloroflexi bacterium]|nr:aromatic ring-hydroxylating dioxygenase subunit alpha [Chloroflexota bacterium]